MRVFRGFDNLPQFRCGVATIGSFDGVHCGHRTLLDRVRSIAKEQGGESIVFTFDPHPRITLGKAEGLRLLSSTEEKLRLLEAEGTTNNRMELMAAISGLEALKEPCQVTLYSDSKYLVDAFCEGWIYSWREKGWRRGKEELKNPDLWERLYDLTKLHTVEFVWVKGHNGHDYNERCDKLATDFADSF